jgi:hypothetical protein
MAMLIAKMLAALHPCISSTSVPKTTQVPQLQLVSSGMKRTLIVVCLAGALFGSKAVAADLFPWWFHTRPKPVLLDDQPPTPADARNRTPNQGADSRRPNFTDDHRVRQLQPSRSRLAEFLTHGWRGDTQRSK